MEFEKKKCSFICKKKIDCWQPADLSKSAEGIKRLMCIGIIQAHWNEHEK